METQLKFPELQRIRYKFELNHGLWVDWNGERNEREGGKFSLMQRYVVKVTISSYSTNHIGGYYEEKDGNEEIYFIGIYGFFGERKKKLGNL